MMNISLSGHAGWLPRRALVHRDAIVVTLHRAEIDAGGFVHEGSIRWQPGPPRLLALPVPTQEPAAPSGMIFHMTRCGSTLAARVLAALECATVVNEPSLIARLLGSPALTPVALAQLLALYAGGIGRPGGPVIVKWQSVVNPRMGLLRDLFPNVPRIFIVRNAIEVMVSCVQRPMPVLDRLTDDLLAPHLRVADLARLDRAERAARYLGSQCFWAAQQAALTVVEYASLPTVALDVLPAYLDCPKAAGDPARMRGQLGIHAKSPGRTFTPDVSAKQLAADARLRELADRIIQPELDALRRRHPRLGTTTHSM
jgi:hypothetical protein